MLVAPGCLTVLVDDSLNSRVPVKLANLSSRTITIPAKTALCRLHDVDRLQEGDPETAISECDNAELSRDGKIPAEEERTVSEESTELGMSQLEKFLNILKEHLHNNQINRVEELLLKGI